MRIKDFLPWYNEEEDNMKDARTDIAVEDSRKVEDRVRKLAQNYQAVGIAVKATRTVATTK